MCSIGHGMRTSTVLPRLTQPCIPPGSLNRVPASAGGKGGNFTYAGWQVTLSDAIRHVSSRSGVAGYSANCYIRILYTGVGQRNCVLDGGTDSPPQTKGHQTGGHLPAPPTPGWLCSRVVIVLDSGAERPGFKSQPRRHKSNTLVTVYSPISGVPIICGPPANIRYGLTVLIHNSGHLGPLYRFGPLGTPALLRLDTPLSPILQVRAH